MLTKKLGCDVLIILLVAINVKSTNITENVTKNLQSTNTTDNTNVVQATNLTKIVDSNYTDVNLKENPLKSAGKLVSALGSTVGITDGIINRASAGLDAAFGGHNNQQHPQQYPTQYQPQYQPQYVPQYPLVLGPPNLNPNIYYQLVPVQIPPQTTFNQPQQQWNPNNQPLGSPQAPNPMGLGQTNLATIPQKQ